MLETLLHELRSIDGVMGAILFTGRGQLLLQSVPRIYLPQMPKLIHTFLSGCAALDGSMLHTHPFECCFKFAEGVLFIRRVNELYLALFCSVGADISSLYMTINMVTGRLRQHQTASSHQANGHRDGGAARDTSSGPQSRRGFGEHLSSLIREELGDGALQYFLEQARNNGIPMNPLPKAMAMKLLQLVEVRCDPLAWARFELRLQRLV